MVADRKFSPDFDFNVIRYSPPGSATWGRRSRPCPYSPIQYWNNLTVSQGDSRVKPALVFLFSIQQTTTDSRYNNSVHWQLFFFTTIFSQHWNISSNYSIFIAHSQSLGTQIILCDHWQESHHYRKSHLSNILSDTWLLIRTEWRQMKVRPLFLQTYVEILLCTAPTPRYMRRERGIAINLHSPS